MKNELLIFIPTYNESENVEIIYSLLKQINLPVEFDILFIDDNSPDGTGDILDKIALNDNKVTVIHRNGKLGIGNAHKQGIEYAYQNNYKKLITMDCDLTHSPEYIADFYKNGDTFEIVIGSRYLDKDSLKSWNLFRKTLTIFGHFLTKYFLNMPYDASGAFRFYNLGKIPTQVFKLIESNSYSFFFESLLILHINKLTIKEIPIKLPKRTYGNSKMKINDAFTSLVFLFKMFIKKNFNKSKITLK
jgi:dolichol-phosphate mannosyltransferase